MQSRSTQSERWTARLAASRASAEFPNRITEHAEIHKNTKCSVNAEKNNIGVNDRAIRAMLKTSLTIHRDNQNVILFRKTAF